MSGEVLQDFWKGDSRFLIETLAALTPAPIGLH
jgi:hypothetical protein